MKCTLILITLVLVAGGAFADSWSLGSTVTNDDTVDPVVKKKMEVSVSALGLFLGSYTAQFEYSAFGDGLIGLGVKATYTNQELFMWSITGFQGLLVARLYPARYTRGFYVMAEGGYSYFSDSTAGYSAGLASLPLMGGLGWKWTINEFSIDAGLARSSHSFGEGVRSI